MPIPGFNQNDVLPPYIGNSPGGPPANMSPYLCSPAEVVQTLGTTAHRRVLLGGWLRHRAALRAAGVTGQFQWVDGSFVERKDPNDIDVVTFYSVPVSMTDAERYQMFFSNPALFRPAQSKVAFGVDAFFVWLGMSPVGLVESTRYWFGLFSHQRTTEIWKGLLRVRFDDPADDAEANVALAELDLAAQAAIALPSPPSSGAAP